MVSFWFPSPEFFSSSVSLVISGSVILSNKNTDEQRGTGDFLSFFLLLCEIMASVCYYTHFFGNLARVELI